MPKRITDLARGKKVIDHRYIDYREVIICTRYR